MKLKTLAASMAAAALVTVSGAALAGTANFDGQSFNFPPSYSEAGITFTSLYPGGHVHLGGYQADTIYNHNGGCCTDPIQITQFGGGAFTLNSLFVVFDNGPTTFVGSNAATYTILGGDVGTTVNFGNLFAGVTYVNWNTDSFGDSEIDNVTINSAVPEPETYAMMLAGLGLLGFAARRRKQKEQAAA